MLICDWWLAVMVDIIALHTVMAEPASVDVTVAAGPDSKAILVYTSVWMIVCSWVTVIVWAGIVTVLVIVFSSTCVDS